jgi:tRNA modification GTPase
LLKCLAHTEAVIDFGDDDREDDINDTVMLPIFPQIKKMLSEINKYLADGRKGEIIRDGLQMALIGSPNAGNIFAISCHYSNTVISGKSSLLNMLARRPAAIVSPVPGTTRFVKPIFAIIDDVYLYRDVVEVRMDIAGMSCIVKDTAGIRSDAVDSIELEGIKRSK